MILTYVFTFLLLISVLGGTFIRKSYTWKVRSKHNVEYYQSYVHCPSREHSSGFNLVDLQSNNVEICDLFLKVVNHCYKSIQFNHADIGTQLLMLIQQKDEKQNYCIKSIDDLKDREKLNMAAELQNAYAFILEGSQVEDGDSQEGCISLFKLINSKNIKNNFIFNLYDTPLPIIECMFGELAAKDLKERRKSIRVKSPTVQFRNRFKEEFIQANHLGAHPYEKWIGFQIPQEN